MSLSNGNLNSIEAQTPEKKAYPGFLQAVWLAVLFVALTILLFIPITIIGRIVGIPFHKDLVLRFIVAFCALVLVLVYGIENTKIGYRNLFPCMPTRAAHLLPFIITLFGLIIVSSELNGLIMAVIPGGRSAANSIIDFISRDVYAAVIFIVVIGPFVEEFFFRGLLLRGFLGRYSTKKAIVLSALLFALYHANIFQIIPAFFGGILFAWWFVKTRSLILCIFGHVITNALIISAVFLLGNQSAHIQELEYGPLWLDLLGVVLLVSGIWLSIRVFKKQTEGSEV